jgi:dihydrofolate reductase
MRKIILGVAVSLDGFIEGPNGEYDWCFTDQDYGMTEFLKSIDGIIYGRKSFQIASAAAGGAENPFAGIASYVVSTTMSASNDYKVLRNVDEIRQLKKEPGKNLWLYGGASLTSSCMNEGLLDEMWLAIHPIVLGKGKPLFENVSKRIHLELIDSKTYATGLLSVRHRVVTR